jgi:hypothetical protein
LPNATNWRRVASFDAEAVCPRDRSRGSCVDLDMPCFTASRRARHATIVITGIVLVGVIIAITSNQNV